MNTHYHLLASLPKAQTNPLPDSGSSTSHTPRCHTMRFWNCRFCIARSFRWSNGSLAESGASDSSTAGVKGLGVVGMIMDFGRRRKCALTCASAGIKYALTSAQTSSMSLTTLDTKSGVRDSRATQVMKTSFEIGILVNLLTLSGIGKDGVTTRMEGMAR